MEGGTYDPTYECLIWEELNKSLTEELNGKQKSRIQWLTRGDHNTHLFHAIAVRQRSKTCISEMTVNGIEVKNVIEIHNAVKDFHFYDNVNAELLEYLWEGPRVLGGEHEAQHAGYCS